MFNLKALQRNKTLKYGVPMLLLIVGGSFGLREFTQIRYDAQRTRRKPGGRDELQGLLSSLSRSRLDPSLEAKVNVQRQSVILEEEYQKMKEVNLDEWKNIRGPRPWEDSREYQEQQRARQDKKD